jgi:carboxymethylenebutenolidase
MLWAMLAPGTAGAEILREELVIEGADRAIPVVRYAAPGTERRPAVLVLHGGSGPDDSPTGYEPHARSLVGRGIDAYLVSYFKPGTGMRCGCWDEWIAAVRLVTEAVLRRPENSGRIGLLGFSLGGALAVAGAGDPRIDAAVIVYGFIPNAEQRARIARLPPLLVLHGDRDDAVPVLSAEEVARLAREKGSRVELKIYPGEPHRLSAWSAPARSDAVRRELDFLTAELVRR